MGYGLLFRYLPDLYVVQGWARWPMMDKHWEYHSYILTVLGPAEVIGSTLGGADEVKVELDDGTDMVSLNGSLEGSNDGIPYG